ncbi:hypothetical protein BGZ70_000195 [Mortierella alpina]|uniref:Uncharacterized protein n=1 Tax=Mortierella alpina TaxID=64518 RepID=A0A9P6IYC4_MORAP|nr:hypothetical protein BGZ70_000195 [Mortierella alpina]
MKQSAPLLHAAGESSSADSKVGSSQNSTTPDLMRSAWSPEEKTLLANLVRQGLHVQDIHSYFPHRTICTLDTRICQLRKQIFKTDSMSKDEIREMRRRSKGSFKHWTADEDAWLMRRIANGSPEDGRLGRTATSCKRRWAIIDPEAKLLHGTWSEEESRKLLQAVCKQLNASDKGSVTMLKEGDHGLKDMDSLQLHNVDWKVVAEAVGTRSNIQCRSHAYKNQRSGCKGRWEPDELRRLEIGLQRHGQDWHKLAELVNTRSAYQVKQNQPSTHMQSLDSFESAVLPSLDTSVVDGPRKHRRVRQPAAAPVCSSSIAAVGAEAGAAAQQATTTAPKPATQPAKSPKGISSLVPDMAVAAAAAFAIPTPSITPSPLPSVNKNVAEAAPALTATDAAAATTATKKKRKNKKRKNNQGAAVDPSTTETSGATAPKATQPAKTGLKTPAQGTASHPKPGLNKNNNKRKQSHHTHGDGQDEGKFKKVHKKDTQKYIRGLDARPELVGVSKEEDFSSLLLKHVEHSNKILQRDLELQSKKMLEDQKKQGELLAAQAALLSNPSALPSNSKKPTPDAARNQRQNQQQRKKDTTPFVPRRDCVYFLKGHCLHETTCKFKHDVEAQAAALAETKLLEAEKKKARGVCKYAIAGSCTNGDQCQFSHNLKEQPCAFYHLFGKCDTGLQCRFGHDPITEVELEVLRETFRKKSEAAAELKAAQGASAAQGESETQPSSVDLSHYGTQGVSIEGTLEIPTTTDSWTTPALLQTGTI